MIFAIFLDLMECPAVDRIEIFFDRTKKEKIVVRIENFANNGLLLAGKRYRYNNSKINETLSLISGETTVQ